MPDRSGRCPDIDASDQNKNQRDHQCGRDSVKVTAHGSSAADAAGQTMALIGQIIQTQATILAYIDVFHLCAISAALMIPLVLVLVRRVNIGATSAPIGH